MNIKFIISVFLIGSLMSCEELDQVQEISDEFTKLRVQAILSLNDGINTLQNESDDWQNVLSNLDESIDNQIQDILTYNIPYITGRANSLFLSSILCVKESVKDDIIYYLMYIRAELITGISPRRPKPKICTTVPQILDLNADPSLRNQVFYTGFNIHSLDSINAIFSHGVTGNMTEIPINQIGFPDISTITVSIATFPDSIVSEFSHLQLRFNEEVISSISIIPKSPIPPEIETDYTDEETILWVPPHTYGDKEFDGNGPRVRIDLYLMSTSKNVYAQIRMDAIETMADWTAAVGVSPWKKIYSVPNGYLIHQFKEPYRYDYIVKINNTDYLDDSTDDFVVETTVGRATVVGDAIGLDAGEKTGITLELRSFELEIIKQ